MEGNEFRKCNPWLRRFFDEDRRREKRTIRKSEDADNSRLLIPPESGQPEEAPNPHEPPAPRGDMEERAVPWGPDRDIDELLESLADVPLSYVAPDIDPDVLARDTAYNHEIEAATMKAQGEVQVENAHRELAGKRHLPDRWPRDRIRELHDEVHRRDLESIIARAEGVDPSRTK